MRCGRLIRLAETRVCVRRASTVYDRAIRCLPATNFLPETIDARRTLLRDDFLAGRSLHVGLRRLGPSRRLADVSARQCPKRRHRRWLALPLPKPGWPARAAAPRSAWGTEDGRTIEEMLEDRMRFDDALQVAIAGDRVYYGSSVDHAVYCRRLSNGETLWRHVTGGPIRLANGVEQPRLHRVR